MHALKALALMLPIGTLAVPTLMVRQANDEPQDTSFLKPTTPAGNDPAHQAGYFGVLFSLNIPKAVLGSSNKGVLTVFANDIISDTRNNKFPTVSNSFHQECKVDIPGIQVTSSGKPNSTDVTLGKVQWPASTTTWIACPRGNMHVNIIGTGAGFKFSLRHGVVGNDSSVTVARNLIVDLQTFSKWNKPQVSDFPENNTVTVELNNLGNRWPNSAYDAPQLTGDPVDLPHSLLVGGSGTAATS